MDGAVASFWDICKVMGVGLEIGEWEFERRLFYLDYCLGIAGLLVAMLPSGL